MSRLLLAQQEACGALILPSVWRFSCLLVRRREHSPFLLPPGLSWLWWVVHLISAVGAAVGRAGGGPGSPSGTGLQAGALAAGVRMSQDLESPNPPRPPPAASGLHPRPEPIPGKGEGLSAPRRHRRGVSG